MRSDLSNQTMIELLASQAALQPDRVAYLFLDDRDGYRDYVRRTGPPGPRIAARLQLELKARRPGTARVPGWAWSSFPHFLVACMRA